MLPTSHCYDGEPLRDALRRAPGIKVQAASVRLRVAPFSAAICLAADPHVN